MKAAILNHITKVCTQCGMTVTWDARRFEKEICPNCKGDKQNLNWIRPIIQNFASLIQKSKRLTSYEKSV